jgi:osmotically inducible protein OsmC
MALTAELEKMRLNAESIETHAEVTLEQDSGVSTITAVLLRVSARIPGASQDQFNEAVSQARHCPVSRLLNAPISLDAKLVDNTAPRLRKVG